MSELVKAGHEVSVLHRAETQRTLPESRQYPMRPEGPRLSRRALGMASSMSLRITPTIGVGTTAADEAPRVPRATACTVMCSCPAAAYGDGLNHHEGDALAPDDHPDPYVRNKATSERMLFRMHQALRIPGGQPAPAVHLRVRQPVLPRGVSFSGTACAMRGPSCRATAAA